MSKWSNVMRTTTGGLALVVAMVALPGGASAIVQQHVGDIVVADQETFGPNNGGLIRVDPVTGARTTLTRNNAPSGGPDLANPNGIAYEANGDIVVADYWTAGDAFGDRVVRVDAASGARTLVSKDGQQSGPDLYLPYGIAVEADGSLLVADYWRVRNSTVIAGAIVRVDPVTGARSFLSKNGNPPGNPQFIGPNDVAVADDGTIFVANRDLGRFHPNIIRVDPQTGARTLVSKNGAPPGGPNLIDPWAITIDNSGDLLVSDMTSSGTSIIIRIDPNTGARTAVSQNGAPPGGPSFNVVGDLAYDPSTGNVFTTDYTARAVFGVDMASGARSLVSDNTHPSGQPNFDKNVFGIALRLVGVSHLSFSPEEIHTGEIIHLRGVAKAAARGTTLSYRLSQAARVAVRIDRLRAGRIVGLTCRAQTHRNRKRRACKLISRVGTVHFTSKQGTNHHHFNGVVAGKRLAPGSYRATVIATGYDGYRSVPLSRTFRVLKH